MAATRDSQSQTPTSLDEDCTTANRPFPRSELAIEGGKVLGVLVGP